MITPTVIFVGPTATRLSPGLLAAAFGSVRPPVRAGDLAAHAHRSSVPGMLCLVDGVLEPELAVPDSEIIEAITAGWTVWGLASVGAMKAVQLRHAGMRGFGRVYRFLRLWRADPLDEVVVLQDPEPPYRRLSESLIELRALIRALRRDGWISPGEGAALKRKMQEHWFGDRTLPQLLSPLEARGELSTISEMIDSQAWRWKQRDLTDFLRARPWVTTAKQT